jgi:hypothetical protein
MKCGARWSSGQCARRAIAEAKHRSQWPVLGWVTKSLLSRAPPCFGRHVKPLVPAAFAVVSTHQSARVVGYGPFSLWVLHKEGLCPSSGDINRLMMSDEVTSNSFNFRYMSASYELLKAAEQASLALASASYLNAIDMDLTLRTQVEKHQLFALEHLQVPDF